MKKFSVLLLLFTYINNHAQKNCGLIHGDFSALVGQTTISVVLEFDSLKVVGYGTEREFIDKMKQEFEAKKVGGGVKWENSWNDKKTTVFAKRFKTLFYKYSKLDSLTQSEFRLVVRPTKLLPGFETDNGTHYAFLSGEAWLIKTSEPNKKLAKLIFYDIKGEGIVADYTGSVRIGDAYAIAGRRVGTLVKTSIKKSKKPRQRNT